MVNTADMLKFIIEKLAKVIDPNGQYIINGDGECVSFNPASTSIILHQEI